MLPTAMILLTNLSFIRRPGEAAPKTRVAAVPGWRVELVRPLQLLIFEWD